MKNLFVKRGLSALLAVVTICVMFPFSVFARAESEPFNESRYISDILLNADYFGSAYSAEEGTTVAAKWLEFYMNPANVSTARILVNELKKSGDFMGAVFVWENVNAVLDPSLIVSGAIKEKDYYLAIIFSILDAKLFDVPAEYKKAESYASYLAKITKGVSGVLKDLHEIDYNNIANQDWDMLDPAKQHDIIQAAAGQLNAFNIQYSKIGEFASAVDNIKTIREYIEKVSSYALLAAINEDVKAVLLDLHTNCSALDNPAMKTALWEAYTACDDAFGAAFTSILDGTFIIVNNSAKEMLKVVWQGAITSAGGGGLVLGQMIGKNLSNFLFSTDGTISQYYAMNALVNFETLITDSVSRLGAEYINGKSEDKAKVFLTSIDIMAAAYELGCDYSLDFVDVAYSKGLVNTIKSFSGENKMVSEFKENIVFIKGLIENFHEQILSISYYKWYLEEDYPDIYRDIFAIISDTGFIAPIQQRTTVPTGYVGIYTAQEFNNIRSDLSGNYILMNHIDLSSYDKWIPIGTSSQPFSGVIEGNGFSVKNLKINITSGGTTYAGLFGYVQSAKFYNLLVSDVNVKSEPDAYYVWGSTIYTYAGGIAGFVTGNGVRFDNCVVSGNITILTTEYNTNCAGGFVGGVSDSVSTIFKDCKNASVVTANGGSAFADSYAGGIIGRIRASTISIENCSNINTVEVPTSYSSYAGGIVADISSGTLTIKGTYNNGYVNAATSHNNCYAGGLVAYDASPSTTTIQNVFNSGDVNAYLPDNLRNCVSGGIIGYSYYPVKLNNAYNTGIITAYAPGSSSAYDGSIGGRIIDTTSSLTNCYYKSDGSVAVKNGTPSQTNVRSISESEMKNADSFTGFDFGAVWGIDSDVNDGYPHLRKLAYSYEPSKSTGAIPFVVIDTPSVTVVKGQSAMLGATLYPHDAIEDRTVTWSTSNLSVATINNGVIVAHNSGVAIITAKIGNFEAYCTVTVVSSDIESVVADKAALTWTVIKGSNNAENDITANLDTLPSIGASGTTITWFSDNADVVSNNGAVSRPTFGSGDNAVTLTATISKGTSSDTVVFSLIIKELPQSDAAAVAADKAALTWGAIQGANSAENNVTVTLDALPLSGANGTIISWGSNNANVVSASGVVTRPVHGSGSATVTLTATIRKGTESDTLVFTLTVKELPAPTVTSVTVSPTTIEVQQGGKQNFTAAVYGTDNPSQSVEWIVENAISENTTITNGGALAVGADETATTLTVRAISTVTGYTDISGTATVTVTTAPPTPVYGISLDISGTHIFTAAQEGYGPQTALTATMTNTGNQATSILNIGLAGDTNAFNVNPTTITDIAAGGNTIFTITPAAGLATNTYTATITVSGNNGVSETFDVSFTISPAITPTYALIVSAGTGGAVYGATTDSYFEGEAISVSAAASNGYHFVNWTVSGATITDGNTSNPATFPMPTNAVTLTANFETDAAATYAVTVNGSSAITSGAGSYAAGATVIINAGNRSNYSFNGWSTTGGALANPDNVTTTFTMPANAVSVTANWTYIGGGTNYPPDNGDATPTNPPTTPSTTPTAVGDTTTIGGNNVTTPKSQEPATNSDGSTNLPGGGTITTPGVGNGNGGITIEAPPGTIITDNGQVSFPAGSGGGTITHDSGHTFHISEDAIIILDDNIPMGYYVAIDDPFKDIDENAWYFNYVMFSHAHGLMVGTNEDPMTFSPNTTATRGMIVTILYRMAGSPDVSGLSNPFNDVVGDKWYFDAVVWAVENGIVSGYGGGLYGPEDNITREQLAVILNNYINYTGLMLSEIREYTGFNDDVDCADYARKAIERFFKSGVVSGKPGNIFDPKSEATRAEVATMLMNFLDAMS